MTQTKEFSYPSSDGVHTIHAHEWFPQSSPIAVIQIVHGVAEHIGRYQHLAQFLTAYGFVVCGEDHLLGHSMGSFLTRTYLIRWPGTVDGAVLSGTGQEKAPLVAFGRLLAGGLAALKGPDYVSPLIYELSLGAYNKKFQPARTRADWLSRDRDMVDANLNDPLCAFQPTVSMFRDMMEGLQFIASKKNLSKMDVDTPIYFLSGDQDPVGSMGKGVRKVEAMFRSAGCRDVTVKLYAGGRHEMFNELNRQEVMEDLLVWLEQRFFD